MTHKPVIGKQNISPLSAFSPVDGTVGVVYESGRATGRLLAAGEKIRTAMRGVTVHSVDIRPHTMLLQARLEGVSPDDDDAFDVSVKVAYCVADPIRMVRDGIEDTESMVTDALLREFARLARQYPVHRYQDLASALAQEVGNIDLQTEYGLEWKGKPSMSLNLTSTQKERLRQRRLPHPRRYESALPSADSRYMFPLVADVVFQVTDESSLLGKIEEADQQLWNAMEAELRQVSIRFQAHEVGLADEALRKLVPSLLQKRQFGVGAVNVTLKLEMDVSMRKHLLDINDIARGGEIDAEKRKVASAALDELLKVAGMGNMALVIEAVRRGELSISAAIAQLDARQREQVQDKLEIIKGFRDSNTKFDTAENAIVEAIGREIVSSMSNWPQDGRLLGSGKPPSQLPPADDGAGKTT